MSLEQQDDVLADPAPAVFDEPQTTAKRKAALDRKSVV